MANQLSMAQVHTIQVLLGQGWSRRRIAQELGIHRDTVAQYARLARAGPDPAGSDAVSKPAKVITGSDPAITEESRSRCGPFREVIELKLQQGLSVQ